MEYFEHLGRELYNADIAEMRAAFGDDPAPETPTEESVSDDLRFQETVSCSLAGVQTRDATWLWNALHDVNRQRGIDRQKVKQRAGNHGDTSGTCPLRIVPTCPHREREGTTHRSNQRKKDPTTPEELPQLTTEFISARWDLENEAPTHGTHESHISIPH